MQRWSNSGVLLLHKGSRQLFKNHFENPRVFVALLKADGAKWAAK